jgi:diphthine synthase
MGELVFIGLGLYDEQGLSLRGQAEAKTCDYVFAELYTSVMPGLMVDRLRKMVAKPVEFLSRTDVEESAQEKILSKAKLGKVAFLVAGDPMVATTHVDLRLRAQKTGIRTRIIHGASVASAAAGITGLQSYKFGRTVTIPVPQQNELPGSVYAALRTNFEAGLHTLVLLEVDVENHRHVTIHQGLEALLVVSARTTDRLIKPETLVVGLARLEAPDMIVHAATVSDLMRMDFGEPPYCLVFPGKLHFVEAEALELFCGARKDLVGVLK